MAEKEREILKKKLENIFFNYYQKTGFVPGEEPVAKNYRQNFLRERFVERVIFTTLDEAGLADLSGKSVLVVGLSQDLVSFLHKLDIEPNRLTLADICAPALEQAQSLYNNQITWSKIDLDSIPLPDESFDLIICQNYLSNIPANDYIVSLANELYRILIPKGLMLLSFTNETADRDTVQASAVMRLFRPDEVKEYFSAFEVINTLDFIPYSFSRFTINETPSYPEKIGFIEDLLIEQRNRYSDTMMILTKNGGEK